jgi:hypothetical protein
MFFKFLPKEFNFFDLFEKQSEYAVYAAVCFKELTSNGVIDETGLRKINAIEHQCDEASHTIFDQLNKTFITPFDREDIHGLAKEIDDVVDMINSIVSRMKIYKVHGNAHLVEFSVHIEASVRTVARAIKELRNLKNMFSIVECCVEINRLENEGDALRDKVLGELFETEKNPIEIIKLKEIYEDAETVLDICEDIAHIIQTILVKQA